MILAKDHYTALNSVNEKQISCLLTLGPVSMGTLGCAREFGETSMFDLSRSNARRHCGLSKSRTRSLYIAGFVARELWKLLYTPCALYMQGQVLDSRHQQQPPLCAVFRGGCFALLYLFSLMDLHLTGKPYRKTVPASTCEPMISDRPGLR